MNEIPAKCGNCGYLFPSGYSVGFVPDDPEVDPKDSGFEATLSVKPTAPVSKPCLMCGRKQGRVLSGEYNFVKDTITLLSAPDSTKEDLERLVEFLRQSQGATTIEEIQEQADREISGLSTLIKNLLAKKPLDMSLGQWLQLIVGILQVLVALWSIERTQKPEPSQVIYEVNNYNIIQCPPSPPSVGEEQYAVSMVGRNDPCPCGSGRKYKKCHGDPSIFIEPQP